MAYFSNATEILLYEETYCWKCKNFRDLKDGRGNRCPIWDLHLTYSYELANSKSKAKKMLDFLIPYKNCEPKQCSMFLKK